MTYSWLCFHSTAENRKWDQKCGFSTQQRVTQVRLAQKSLLLFRTVKMRT